jgi:hypothetical protein
LVWRPMLVERGGCPAAAARAAAESGKQSWLAEAKVELATGARGKSRELRRFACCRGVGERWRAALGAGHGSLAC